MATVSKRRAPSDCAAYLELSVDLPSIGARTSIDQQITAPTAAAVFRPNRPIVVTIKSTATAQTAGLHLGLGRIVYNSGRKIEFRVTNVTASPIDAAAIVMQFVQY
jgi:hypothetical protein